MGERSIYFFSFLELDLLIERFYPKTRFRQTLSVQKNTDKEKSGNNTEKCIFLLRF